MRIVYIAHPVRHYKIIEPLSESAVEIVQIFNFRKKLIPQFISLHKALKSGKVDLILTDNQGKHGAFAFVLRLLFSVPYFMRLRGDIWEERKTFARMAPNIFGKMYYKFSAKLGTFLINKSNGIIANSCFIKKKILSNTDVPENRIKIVEIPLNNSIIKEAQVAEHEKNPGTNRKRNIFLSITHFDIYNKMKGLIFFLPTMRKIFDEVAKNAVWLIIGEGSYKYMFQESLMKFGMSEVTTLIGCVNNIGEYYRNADMLLHFSFQEAFPNVVIEAQAFGKPVCVNRFGGMLEQVEDGKTGVIVDNENNDETFMKIKRVIVDHSFRSAIGQSGKEEAFRRFTPQTIGKKFEESLKILLADKHKTKREPR